MDELEQAQRAITDLEAERGDDQEVQRLHDELQELQARPLDRLAVQRAPSSSTAIHPRRENLMSMLRFRTSSSYSLRAIRYWRRR